MTIKLLLIEDVDDLGRSGDLVAVKPGYARNFLIPQQFAVVADKRTVKMQARLQEERQKKAVEDKKESEELAQRLEGLTITTIVKVDHEGHMYGSVTSADVVDLMKEQHSMEIERKSVPLKHAIKETGVTELILKLKEGITANVTLKVIPEEGRGKAEHVALKPSEETAEK